MRTTVTLDPDVAELIRRARKDGSRSLKDVVNEALRASLARPEENRFETPSLDVGSCLIGDAVGISEVLPIAEGHGYR